MDVARSEREERRGWGWLRAKGASGILISLCFKAHGMQISANYKNAYQKGTRSLWWGLKHQFHACLEAEKTKQKKRPVLERI